jgi:nicotinamidase-related amidase
MRILLVTNLIYGSARPYCPLTCEKPYSTIEKIVKASQQFDITFVVCDEHSKDDVEFKYLPPHMVKNTQDTFRLSEYEKELGLRQFLYKQTLSAVADEHNQKTILNYKPDMIALAGFTASFDIMATALNLIDLKQNISLLPDCIGDLTEDHRVKALNHLSFLGIKSLELK